MIRRLLCSGAQDVIRFTVTPVASKTLTLQDFTAPYAAEVDWGDGSAKSKITSNTPVTHTYADATPRQVTIKGRLGGFWNSATRAAGTNIVTSVDEINSESLVSFGETFRQCTSLKTLPTAVKASKLDNFTRSFYQCKSIESALPAVWLTHASAAHASCFTQCFLSLYGKYGTACSNRSYVEAVAGQTYYEKYGTSCSAATYHAAVSKQTYYQKYGTSCTYRSYVAGTSKVTYYSYYGKEDCPNYTYVYKYTVKCVSCGSTITSNASNCSSKSGFTNSSNTIRCPSCNSISTKITYYGCNSSCSKVKTPATSAYYKCTSSSTSGVSKCSSSCNKTYQSAQAAYYSCGQSGASGTSKCTSSCNRDYVTAQSAYYKCTKKNATCTTTNCEYPYANEADVTAARNAGWA